MLLAFTVIFATFAMSVIIIVAAYSINLYAGANSRGCHDVADSCHKVSSCGGHEGVRCAKDRWQLMQEEGLFP